MRTALNLSAAGSLAFFAVGEDLPEPEELGRALDALNQRAALFIDDAEWLGRRAADYLARLARVNKPPVLVCAIRTNALYGVADTAHEELWVGELTDPDIDALIDVMQAARTLGKATDLARSAIRDQFRIRAKKQILVAMKEVTAGRDFDEIIRREYGEIEIPELRLTYLIACLATAAGASLTRGQLLAASELPPAVLLSSLERELRDVLVRASEFGDRVIARHSVIASTVVEEIAPRPILSEAYKRILTVLANDMDGNAKRGTERYRWFRLYKVLVNHADIYHRFERSIDEARAIFDALQSKLSNDAHYWLQYGSLELEYGELDFANRYINLANTLAPNDFQIRSARGHLILALARAAQDSTEAVSLRREGETVLNELIDERGDEEDYPWHILISHTLDWIETWVPDLKQKRVELKRLLERSGLACESRPQSHMILKLHDRVRRAYLMTVTDTE
jgi:tetratricopeptide (TPR) repeat protein